SRRTASGHLGKEERPVTLLRLLPAAFLIASALPGQVTYERILRADREPDNWLTYSGTYSGARYSPLTQINRDNVKRLELKWIYHPRYVKFGNNQAKMENTPVVVDGILYTGTALELVALDAVTGRVFWRLPHPLDPNAYYNAYEVNKGVGISGDTLYWATVD